LLDCSHHASTLFWKLSLDSPGTYRGCELDRLLSDDGDDGVVNEDSLGGSFGRSKSSNHFLISRSLQSILPLQSSISSLLDWVVDSGVGSLSFSSGSGSGVGTDSADLVGEERTGTGGSTGFSSGFGNSFLDFVCYVGNSFDVFSLIFKPSLEIHPVHIQLGGVTKKLLTRQESRWQV